MTNGSSLISSKEIKISPGVYTLQPTDIFVGAEALSVMDHRVRSVSQIQSGYLGRHRVNPVTPVKTRSMSGPMSGSSHK